MKSKHIIVVGEKFASIADNKFVLKFKDFIYFIYFLNQKKIYEITYIIHIGQGLSVFEILILKYIFKRRKNIFQFEKKFKNINFCDKKIVHKEKQKNVMISAPEHIQKNEYQCALLLDERCAEMSDHTTGHHIQGMIIIEASRQMVLAVSEMFLLPEDLKYTKYFITNEIKVKHKSYLFPLETRIVLYIEKLRIGLENDFTGIAKVIFYQNKMPSTEIIFNFSAFNKKYMIQKESNLIHKSILENIK
jgi:hypothetical protein